MEIEINFRFDENGRTANTKVDSASSVSHETNTASNENQTKTNEIDYAFKAVMTDLKTSFGTSLSSSSMLDDILLDCEISDNMIMPRTYWMPADGTKARCTLEQFALDVFHCHVPSEGFDYDRETSGAEWWCQLRPSPETGRHSAVQDCDNKNENDNNEADPFANGISFHVDKDEELRILTGGSTHLHPHLSTITYLTDLGSPTLIMDCLVHPLTGEWIVPEDSIQGFVSWPSVGKHTSFDGRYLHASPPDLMGGEDAFQKQLETAEKAIEQDADDKNSTNVISSKAKKRRCRRVTFLVNIWLNYKPYGVNQFPELMVDKMSGRDDKTRKGLGFGRTSASAQSNNKNDDDDDKALHVKETIVKSNQTIELGSNSTLKEASTKTCKAQKFSWPLGDKRSGEKLECFIPLQSIEESSEGGGNVKIQWQTQKSSTTTQTESDDCCFRLFDGKSSVAEASPKTVVETVSETPPLPNDEEKKDDPTTNISSDIESNKRRRLDEVTDC